MLDYNLGYLGNNQIIADSLLSYSSKEKKGKVNYINLSSLSQEDLESLDLNGLVFETELHENQDLESLLKELISNNEGIDVMPVMHLPSKNEYLEVLSSMQAEIDYMKENYNITTIPFKVDSAKEATIFSDSILSNACEKTLNMMQKINTEMERIESENKTNIANAFVAGRKSGTMELIKKVVTMLEFKDPYTRDHSNRVSIYSRAIAKELELDPEQTNDVIDAAWLHDAGKLIVPDDILGKNSRLDDKEFSVMKSHASLATLLLPKDNSDEYPEEDYSKIKSYIRGHHEKYDGSGYPDHKVGKDIPLGARIISVADAFDAMTTQRTYNKPKKLSEAIEELRNCSNKQFDPEAADAFINILEREPEVLKDVLGIDIDENGYIKVQQGEALKNETKRIEEDTI